MPYNLTLKDRLLIWLGVCLLKIIYLSCKKSFIFSDSATSALMERRRLVAIFWHGNQLMLPFLYQQACKKFGQINFVMLISAHRDGRLISKAIEHFGISSVAGSSTRHAHSASRQLIDHINQGAIVGITPDGPKGPIYQAKPGAFKIAQLTNAESIPIRIKASRCWNFNSWDKMMLPKPFSKLSFSVEEVIRCTADDTNNVTLIEAALNQSNLRS